MMTRKQIAFLICVWMLGCLLASAAFGQISGPVSVQSGTLAIFETDQKADWSISPTPKAAGMFFADSSGKRIYFASPIAGEYEVNAATVENGEPKLHTFAFTNGDGKTIPSPEPPTPPEPEPETFADWIKANIPIGATQSELSGISGLFESVSARIKQGTIRSVDQAFASIRTHTGRYEAWKPFFKKLEEREELQTDEAKQLGETFREIASQVSGVRIQESGFRNQDSVVRDHVEIEKPDAWNLNPEACETGNCPTPQKPVKPQSTKRRRW